MLSVVAHVQLCPISRGVERTGLGTLPFLPLWEISVELLWVVTTLPLLSRLQPWNTPSCFFVCNCHSEAMETFTALITFRGSSSPMGSKPSDYEICGAESHLYCVLLHDKWPSCRIDFFITVVEKWTFRILDQLDTSELILYF